MLWYELALTVLVFGAFSLLAAWVLFRGLESTAGLEGEHPLLGSWGPKVRLGGAIVGFVVVFSQLLHFGLPDDDAIYWAASRPGGAAIVQFYRQVNEASDESLTNAFELLGPQWRRQFIGDLDDFRNAYLTTVPGSHEHLQVQLIEDSLTSEQEKYLVSFDVVDRFPQMSAQTGLASRTLSELREMASQRTGVLRDQFVRDLGRQYQVSPSQEQQVRDFWERSTLRTLLSADLAREVARKLALERKPGLGMDADRREVRHHLRKIITVIRRESEWQIVDVRTLFDGIYAMPEVATR